MRRTSDWVLVGILTAAGFGLRLAYLVRVPPFLDEYSSILAGMSILRTGVPRLPSGVLYPSGSLFSYLEAVFLGFLGVGDVVARLPSLLLSTLTLPVLYLVARTLLNRRVALLSVALLAFAPEAVVWGGRARMYALLQLLALVTVYCFYRAVLEPRPNRRDASPPAWLWVPPFWAAIFGQDEAILLLPLFWLAALVARGARWFFQPRVVVSQALVPLAGVAIRYWLNEIRVPGEVYTLVHDSFFRFPPALAHGLVKLGPFFTAPGTWPVALLFLVALVYWLRDYVSRRAADSSGPAPVSHSLVAPAFLAGLFLGIAASMILVVNLPWQDDRYLFMVLPLFLMVAAWGLDRLLSTLGRRWPPVATAWATAVLVVGVSGLALPAGLQAVHRFEPDYSAAYRWVATQLRPEDWVGTMRPAPASVYLGRADYLLAEDRHQEFIMRLDGVWMDRWTGARVVDSPEAFRQEVLATGRRTWFVIDEDRFESVAYSPEMVALIVEQMDLVWRQGGVLVFRGQGYEPLPEMAVRRSLAADFRGEVRLTGYALSTDRPQPGEGVTLQLLWQAVHPTRDYTVFVHVVGSDGRGLTQVDGEPLLGLYGMSTHWPRDRAVPDLRRLAIPADTAPGRYRIDVGLYDASDPQSEPLPVGDEQGSSGGASLVLDFLRVDVPPAPDPQQLVDPGNLGQRARLVGYDPPPPLVIAAGESLPLTLTWESLAPFDADYTVFVHLVGDDGRPVAQSDSQPLGGFYPTRFWDVGERVVDPYRLAIPADLPPGEYELQGGMYLLSTNTRLPVLGASGQVVSDSLSLGKVEILAPRP